MTKKMANKWIRALRSGKYTQGRHELYTPATNRYCCLGVLCDLYPELQLNSIFGAVVSESTLYNHHRAGLADAVGTIPYSGVSLASLNDIGYSFNEIADIIQLVYVERL